MSLTQLRIAWFTRFLSLFYPGEYITLYQTQRNALKSYYKDRERMIAQLSSEKANMQVRRLLGYLIKSQFAVYYLRCDYFI